jgi:D-proline reductase (dithiol) PrdB
MAEIKDLSGELQQFVRTYAWQHIDPVPWAEPKAPASSLRVGLVVTACEKLPDQEHFTGMDTGGDPTFRIFSADGSVSDLVNDYAEQAFDHAGLHADPNLLVPLDRMREMARAGTIGEFSPRVVSMCGHIPKPRRLIDETAPQIANLFAEDGAGAVVLVPA